MFKSGKNANARTAHRRGWGIYCRIFGHSRSKERTKFLATKGHLTSVCRWCRTPMEEGPQGWKATSDLKAGEPKSAEAQKRHLFTLALDVDFANLTESAITPRGWHRTAPIQGGSFDGERLRGSVLPGAEWVVHYAHGKLLIDVQVVLRTDGGGTINLFYQGLLTAQPKILDHYAKGGPLNPADYSKTRIARLESRDERYSWLNNCDCVATSVQSASGPIYDFFGIVPEPTA